MKLTFVQIKMKQVLYTHSISGELQMVLGMSYSQLTIVFR